MGGNRKIITLIVASALFMQNVDSTVLGTAIATIARSLHTDPVRLHTAMTGYLLSLAVFMPISGWLADRYGTRTIFRLAIAIFTLASVACAFAPSLGWLVFARVVQGFGGALMLPVARLALLKAVPKEELINAMAWVSIPALVGPIIGPPLGGFIVGYWSWPWIFWINVPIGILGFVLATLFLDDAREEIIPKLDLAGLLLLAVGLSGLVFGLETIGDSGLPAWVNILAVAIGVPTLAAYVVHAKRTAAPALDLRLLKLPTFFAGVVSGGFFRMGVGALPFLLPLLLQAGFGYSPLRSGMTTFAAAFGAISVKLGAEFLIRTFGFRRTLIWNSVLSALSLAACILFTPATPVAIIFIVLMIGGFFRSLSFTALNALTYADIDQRAMSQATSFAAVAQQLALSLGIGLSALLVGLARGNAETTSSGDFTVAFAVIGAIMLLSALQFARLAPNAGSALSVRPPPD